MIHVIVSTQNSLTKTNIINFVKYNIKPYYNYQLHFEKNHMRDFSFVNLKKDIVLWQPNIANFNLENVKECYYSIVILDKPTIYVQKISKYNYINENMAINGGFFILYLNPNDNDITNNEWKLPVNESTYLITFDKLGILIKRDITNLKSIENTKQISNIKIQQKEDNFNVKTNMKQINLQS